MIGGGYVGLVSGACFAELGNDVAIVEVDPTKLARLRSGGIPIYEPGLDLLVSDNVKAARLTFGDNIAAAVTGADAVFIAVGTPTRRGDGHADLSYVCGRRAGGKGPDSLYSYCYEIYGPGWNRSTHTRDFSGCTTRSRDRCCL